MRWNKSLISLHFGKGPFHAIRVGPREVTAPGRPMIWRPFKAILFKGFRPRTKLATFLGARVQIAENFRMKFFRVWKA